ncbi:MAG TPA: GSU2403 family nucleotidyltransferase fold protein [Allosphingosinicella sp.]|nr:GSU2403 family nucleotidyltransferase fold protein [Allosphingosinicella sp.]
MPRPFSDEQLRTLVNLAQHYAVWIESERTLAALPYDLRRKTIAGRDYLYEIIDRSGNGRSLGPWSEDLELRFDRYRSAKAEAKNRRELSVATLAETCRLYRALRLPMIGSEAAAILREADRRTLLGAELLLIGTNAIPAYAIEAAAFLDAPMETQDLDLAWAADEPGSGTDKVWPMLKAVDQTYTVNTERPCQARNAAAYEVELLIAPSRAGSLSRTDQPRPVPLPEQEWLLMGSRVDRVVVGRDGAPARIVAPDPRWFALHKLWLADKPGRNPLKRSKDAQQGLAVLDAVHLSMPQFPLDAAFEESLPDELAMPFDKWRARIPKRPRPEW